MSVTYQVATKPGVYWSQVKVVFLAPSSSRFPNALVNASGGIISVAGTVGRLVDPRAPSAHVSSPTVTLADQGIRDGYTVTLPNDGNQFADNFDQPLLDVQAVGGSVAAVTAVMQRLISQIKANLTTLQDRVNVAPANRITTSLSPSRIQIHYIAGSRARAVSACLALGLAITAAAAFLLRRRLRSRRAA